MPITLQSTRFGDLELPDDDTIVFADGLVGLPGSRYALLQPGGADEAFAWLQSLDDPQLALPVARPGRFFPDYAVVLDPADLAGGSGASAGVPGEATSAAPDPATAEVWVIVRAAERLEDFVANLRAPLLLAGGHGWQVINRAPDAALRAPLLPAAPTPGPVDGAC